MSGKVFICSKIKTFRSVIPLSFRITGKASTICTEALIRTFGEREWDLVSMSDTDLKHWQGPFPVFSPDRDFYSEENFWAPEVHPFRGKYYMFASFLRKTIKGEERDTGCRQARWDLLSHTVKGLYSERLGCFGWNVFCRSTRTALDDFLP